MRCASWVGLVRRVKGRGAASRTRFRDRRRLTGELARIARTTLREVQAVARNARRILAGRPEDGRSADWLGS
jgi:hypothetical protein